MRVIINSIDLDDIDAVQSVLENMVKEKHDKCIYKFCNGSVFFVKKTKSGYSVFKELEAHEEGKNG